MGCGSNFHTCRRMPVKAPRTAASVASLSNKSDNKSSTGFNNKRDYEKAFQSGGEGCPGPSAVEVRRKDVALEVTRHSSRSLQARPRPTKWYVKCSGRLVENTAFISLRLGTASCCAVMEPK